MYVNEIKDPWRRGRVTVRCKDRVKDYMPGRVADRGEGLNEQGWSAWIGSCGGFSAVTIPLWDVTGGNKTVE